MLEIRLNVALSIFLKLFPSPFPRTCRLLMELQEDRRLGKPFLTCTMPLIVIINLECMIL
jgi:hypothetical protein